MSVEEECRRQIDASLWEVHELTTGTEFPGALLVNKMNELLRAVVDTNFGVGCSGSLSSLYQTIGLVAPEMIERCEDLPLLYFARSFSVVLEEAVRQLQQKEQLLQATESLPNALPHTKESWSSETPREDQLIQGEVFPQKKEEDERNVSPSDSRSCSSQSQQTSGESRSFLSPLAPHSETRLNWRAPLTPSDRSTSGAAAAPAADTSLYRSEAWRRAMQLKRTDKILDFSPEAIKGRVNIFNVAPHIHPIELRRLLEPYGPILEFFFNAARTNDTSAYVLTKLESPAKASEAISCLDGKMVGGKRLDVKRAIYWTRLHTDPHPSEQHMPLQQRLQHFQQQRSRSVAAAAIAPPEVAARAAVVPAPAAATSTVSPVGYLRRAGFDSDDDSSEEWRDDLSYDSMSNVD